MNEELMKQMEMLESLNLNNPEPVIPSQPIQPQMQPVETAETLLGEVPFGSVVAPVNTMARPTQPQTVAPVQPTVDLNQAPVFVDLKKSAFQTKTDFLTLKEGERTRVTIANFNLQRNRIHYIDGLGKVKCNSQYADFSSWAYPTVKCNCCTFTDKEGKEIKAKSRLLVPVLEYPVNKLDGKTVTGSEVKLKMWDMNVMEEKSLMSILEEYSNGDNLMSADVTTFDLSLSKNKNGDFAIITLVPAPSWRSKFQASINTELAKINNDFYTTAFKESAKTVSSESIQNVLNQKQDSMIMAQQLMNQQIPTMNDINFNT